MKSEKNPFQLLEPTDQEPSPELKERVMKRIVFKRLMTDILTLFSVNYGRSAGQLGVNNKKVNSDRNKK